MGQLPTKSIQDILESETADSRFERFCVALFSEVDGVDYVTTSASWDLGRDGRQASLFNNEIFPIIAVSLNEKVGPKLALDIGRLIKTTNVSTIRFCSSQPLSEHKLESIKAHLAQLTTSHLTIAVEGVQQIAEIIAKRVSRVHIFEKYYPGEVAERRAILAAQEEHREVSVSGMQIALSTQLTNDGVDLKNNLLKNLILSTLSDSKAKTHAAITKALSDSLSLGKIVYQAYITAALSDLEEKQLIRVASSGGIEITSLGQKELADCRVARAERLGQGRQYVYQAIEQNSGHRLSDTEFDSVWAVIQHELSEILYLNGIQTINALSALVSQNETGVSGQVDLANRIQQMGQKITETLSRTPRVRADSHGSKSRTKKQKAAPKENPADAPSPMAIDVGQAVVDAFSDTSTEVFDWLTTLCACYTAICSLGLSEASQEALLRKLKNIDLFLDTDIVLSWLAEGEPDHRKIQSLVEGWKNVGGEIHIAIPVLEELAYHASISESDFREVFHQLGTYTETDAQRLITNAFVRGYWAVAKRLRCSHSYSSWREYIRNFRGVSELDYSKLSDDLKSDGFFPSSTENVDPNIAKRVSDSISNLKTGASASRNPELLKKGFDKSDRDGRLVAHVCHHRKSKEAKKGTAVIVSSSPMLARVCREIGILRGDTAIVLPLSSVAYLLSLAPGAHISLYSLKRLLFDAKFHTHMSPLMRDALRLLRNSQEYSLPFSRRANLEREMNDKILKYAEQRGERHQQTREMLADRNNKDSLKLMAEIVQDSIDAVAISQSEKENRILRAKIERLEQELKRVRT